VLYACQDVDYDRRASLFLGPEAILELAPPALGIATNDAHRGFVALLAWLGLEFSPFRGPAVGRASLWSQLCSLMNIRW